MLNKLIPKHLLRYGGTGMKNWLFGGWVLYANRRYSLLSDIWV